MLYCCYIVPPSASMRSITWIGSTSGTALLHSIRKSSVAYKLCTCNQSRLLMCNCAAKCLVLLLSR